MYDPVIIATLFAGDEDPAHMIYGQAYGIEMQVDDEWNAGIILLVHPEYLKSVTEKTDVTGEDARIVAAGVTDLPLDADGNGCLEALKHEKNNWLLIGHDAICKGTESVDAQIQLAMLSGCRILLCVDAADRDATLGRVAMCGDIHSGNMIIVLQHADRIDTESLTTLIKSIKASPSGPMHAVRFAVEIPEAACDEWRPSDNICGLFMVGTSGNIFGRVLDVANRVGTDA